MDEYGWLDTAVFVHPLFSKDPLAPTCREVLGRIERGEATAWLDVLVLHELTYVLPRTKLPAFASRPGVVDYLRRILALDAIQADSKDELLETLAVWASRTVAFADARLAVLAGRRRQPVCSPNRRDFAASANSFPGSG